MEGYGSREDESETFTADHSNRNKDMTKEEITVSDGKGIIDVKGGPVETVLYIRGVPSTVCFFAEQGTTLRYQVGREIGEDLVRENHDYEELVRSGSIDSSRTLSEQFRHIVQLLSNGDYQLQVCEFSSNFEISPAIGADEEKPYYDNYGGCVELTATQSHLNRKTVEEYRKRIHNGEKPIPILIRIMDSWTTYILDGHHKLTAYREAGTDTRALFITSLDYTTIDEDEAVATMKSLGLDSNKFIDIYRAEKTSRAYERNFYNCYLKGLREYFK